MNVPDYVPTPLEDPPAHLAAGWAHTAFVTQSGKTILCGRAIDMRNALRFGKLAQSRPRWATFWTQYLGGKGSIDFPEPTSVSGNLKCRIISASAGLTVGITEEGSGFAIGANRYGQTGTENVTDDRPVFSALPIKLPEGAAKLMDISAGHQNVCAVDIVGNIYSWGKGDRGQSGRGEDGVKESPSRLPVKLQPFDSDGIRSVRCGFFHCLALSRSGKVYVWGRQQLDGGTKDALVPTVVQGLPPVVEIACGQYHSVARDVEGNVYQWGLRPFDLGGDFIGNPQRIPGVPSGAQSLSCGFTESAAIVDGAVFVWDWKDMRARPMKELEGFRVEQLAFGWQHKAALVV